MTGTVIAVSRSPTHTFSKTIADGVRLLAGLGVEGDCHNGATVKHLSRLLRFGNAPNLRQVHLIHEELFDELRQAGFSLSAGDMGENITTRGVDLLSLPKGTRLQLGGEAVIEVTGLRNPCRQLDRLQSGLMAATLGRDEAGALIRKAGVMSIVVAGGEVFAGDPIRVELPASPHEPLAPV
ncbi:MAG TPA: MOSC domain-containing protein [Stellaceae bacterium]